MQAFQLLRTTLLGLVIAGSPGLALAADQTQRVQFAPGATSTTLTGTVKGYDTARYLLGASGGQTMTVRLQAQNTSCYFNVAAPGAEEALFNGSINGDSYNGELPASGDYSVDVYLMRNAARRDETCSFEITVSIAD